MLTAYSGRALALAALVLVGVTGCSIRSPDREPEVIRATLSPESTEDTAVAPEQDESGETATTETEAESESDRSPQPERPSLADQRALLSGPAQLDKPRALGQAVAVFYRMRSRAFMAPVASHVQSAVNLGSSGGERETRRCPEGGVFYLEWQGNDRERAGARDLLYRFDECRGHFGDGPLLSLNGEYRRDFQPREGHEQVMEYFDVHGFMGEGNDRQPIALRGRQRIRRPAEGGVIRNTERMEMLQGETYTALEGVRDAIVPDKGDDSGGEFASFDTRFVTTLKGRLYSSALGGWVDMATPAGLVEQQAPCSASGVLALSGGRNGEARFGPHTGTHHRVALELKSGEVVRFKRCSGFGEAFGFSR